jgi:periplasmic protein TonB
MGFLRAIALAATVLALAGSVWTQAQKDSATVVDTPAATEDPAFAAFPPVTKDIKPPKAISTPDPKYPDLPADSDPQGTVVLLIGINAKGHVEAVQVMRSDEAAFEKPAVETVKKWKFKPAQKSGHAVPVQVTVEMKFQR